MSGAGAERLFFALWPDEPAREALARIARRALRRGRGRLVRPENLHLTLLFLGPVDAGSRACVEAAAARVEAGPFELVLERLGSFPRARVAWSAPSRTPPALHGLVGALRREVSACPVALDARAFAAHVTVARKLARPLPSTAHEPVRWPVDAFRLVASETRPEGARYRAVAEWPLGDAPAPGRGRGERAPGSGG